MDIPLLRLLGSKVPELLPYPEVYANWEEWMGAVLLLKSARQVMPRSGDKMLETLTWGDINKVYIGHPFSQAFPFLRHLLDMPEAALADCDLCVRVAIPIGGASERLVVSPAREHDGILPMPGGQSSHPLSSPHWDQQQAWVEGRPTPLLVEAAERALRLRPVPME